MNLEKETFDSVKALSDIQVNLANGRAELKKLQETTEEYLVFRENQANERVTKVLQESREALEHISTNYDQLDAYSKELAAFAVTLKNSSDTIVTLFENFRKKMDEADADMKAYYARLQEVLKEIKIQGTKVESARKQLKVEQKRIDDETRLLNDRRETLERGFAELRKLKEKKL